MSRSLTIPPPLWCSEWCRRCAGSRGAGAGDRQVGAGAGGVEDDAVDRGACAEEMFLEGDVARADGGVADIQRGAAAAGEVIAGAGHLDGAAAVGDEAIGACRVEGQVAAGEVVVGVGAGIAAELDAATARCYR